MKWKSMSVIEEKRYINWKSPNSNTTFYHFTFSIKYILEGLLASMLALSYMISNVVRKYIFQKKSCV